MKITKENCRSIARETKSVCCNGGKLYVFTNGDYASWHGDTCPYWQLTGRDVLTTFVRPASVKEVQDAIQEAQQERTRELAADYDVYG